MPANKMERFTQRAQRVLTLAQEEAEQLQHSSIGTEHFLLGLIREEQGVASYVLRDSGLNHDGLRALVIELSQIPARQVGKLLDLSADTKRVLERAVAEARRLGHHYIGTEHFLLGLVQQPDSITDTILKRLNITPDMIRQEVMHVLKRNENIAVQPGTGALLNRVRTGIARMMPGAQPYAPVTNAEAMKILQLIEDGKVTADEGERLLKALPSVGFPLPQQNMAFLQWMGVKDAGQLRLVITEKATHNVRFDIRIPIDAGTMAALMTVEDMLKSNDIRDSTYGIDLFLYANDEASEEAS
jgi:hypothetical protein